MPNNTTFLALVLPLFGEFADSWDQVLDQNFETLDDHLADLRKALVTGSAASPATSAYASLLGTLFNLADRLNVSINPDGTLNLQNSPAIAALGSSTTNGDDYLGTGQPNNSPRLRFDYSDLETFAARSPLYASRFDPAASTLGLLDDGLAVRARDGGAYDAAHPISTPDRPFVAGLVQGPDSFLSGVGPNQVKFDATLGTPSSWPVFNIDGYVFRIRQGLILDVTIDVTGNLLNPGDIAYLYVSRFDYGNGNCRVKLATDPGAPGGKDVRTLQSGLDGTISGKTFSSASALFSGSQNQWVVLPGDVLILNGGPADGRYVIDSILGPGQLKIKGTFKADALTNQPWYIEDDAHPHIGCLRVTDATSDPPFVPGRVYIGRGEVNAAGFRPVGGAPFTKIAFPSSGVYDSGWVAGLSTASFPLTLEHNLGVVPSHIEVWVRESSASDAFQPTVVRQLLVDFDTSHNPVQPTDPKKANLRLPSMVWRSNRQRTVVQLSAQNPNAPPHLFTREDDTTNIDAGELRLVARR